MEKLEYTLPGQRTAPAFAPLLVGVVGSGNLEVLLEPISGSAVCRYTINTSARGFGTIWQAVVQSFHQRHGYQGLCITINDMGATPAVVSLRLDQALASLPAAAR